MAQQDTNAGRNLLGKSKEELRALLESLGEPGYRGAQIYHALYAERRFDFGAMSNLPAALRERLAREACIELPRVVRRHRSLDGTVRYVLALGDAAKRQTGHRNGIYAGGKSSNDLHLNAGWLRGGLQVLPHGHSRPDAKSHRGRNRRTSTRRISGQPRRFKPQTNIVLMGQGEPLLNYDAVMAALRILLDQEAVAISPRHAALSTSGIIPGIERLAQEKVRPNLAISLNASSSEQRDKIMPINRKYPLEKLLEACRQISTATAGMATVRVRLAQRIQ